METPVIIEFETEFNTVENTMTQTFSNRIKLLVDFKNCIIVLFKDDNIAEKFTFSENYTLSNFERYQRQVINLANTL